MGFVSKHSRVLVARVTNNQAFARSRVLNYQELDEEHLIDAQTSVAPCVQIENYVLAGSELRCAEDYAAAGANLSAFFFDTISPSVICPLNTSRTRKRT